MLDQAATLTEPRLTEMADVPATLAEPDNSTPKPSPMEEAARLSQDLKRLLDGCEIAHLEQDVKDHVSRLNRWTETYMSGLEAAQKLSESATDTLIEAQRELSLSLDQYLRLEDEGGNVATPAQAHHVEQLSKTLKHINKLIPTVETAFAEATQPQDEPEPEPEMNPEPAPEYNPDLQPDIPPVETPDVKAV